MLRQDNNDVKGQARRVYETKSAVQKRSIVIGGHKTSVSLEDAFWQSLKEIAGERGQTLSDLVAEIDGRRAQGNLSSAIRLFVLDHYRGPEDPEQTLPHYSAPRLADDAGQEPVKGLAKD